MILGKKNSKFRPRNLSLKVAGLKFWEEFNNFLPKTNINHNINTLVLNGVERGRFVWLFINL
jgi:hypothetical protein